MLTQPQARVIIILLMATISAATAPLASNQKGSSDDIEHPPFRSPSIMIPIDRIGNGDVEIVGRLNRRLGTVITLEVEFKQEKFDPPRKAFDSQTVVTVISINGERLQQPVQFTQIRISDPDLRNRVQQNQRFQVRGYETINASGIPVGYDNPPQGFEYSIQSELVIYSLPQSPPSPYSTVPKPN
jgi:hypothetical protein